VAEELATFQAMVSSAMESVLTRQYRPRRGGEQVGGQVPEGGDVQFKTQMAHRPDLRPFARTTAWLGLAGRLSG
jgi:hypothetical protein